MAAARDRYPASASAAERRFVVGISGASGAVYARRLIEALTLDPAHRIDLTWTSAGLRVMSDELDRVASHDAPGDSAANDATGPSPNERGAASRILDYFDLSAEQRARIACHPATDIGAGPASGTYPVEAMIVVPCSMNTVASIAHGLQPNLLTRAAAVTLKEGRPLLLVPRETPLGLIELRNLTALAEAGAIILPADPGFYHRPQSVEEIVDFIVQKILDRLGVPFENPVRWGVNLSERD